MAEPMKILAIALGLGLMTASSPVLAHDQKITVLRGQVATTAVSITRNEGDTGITVHRGSSTFVPKKAVSKEPVTFIGGETVRIDHLEPTGAWFLDRSGDQLVVVHCYTRQSVYVGGKRRILCNARSL